MSLIPLAFAFGYLLGSIPFGLIITRAAGSGDIRNIGSGNIGATNVLRTGHKGLAGATLICDMLKGTLAAVGTHYFAGIAADSVQPVDPQIIALVAGLAAFLGHLFPVWLKFKGGKGVATYIGVLLGLCWQAALIFGALWLAVAALFRYSSLAALIASALTPPVLLALDRPKAAALFFVLTILIWIMHRANIRRLLGGSEDKIGAKT